MPLAMAGALQDPPVSSHSDHGANLAAMDDADPPLLPAAKKQKLRDGWELNRVANGNGPMAQLCVHRETQGISAAVVAACPWLPGCSKDQTVQDLHRELTGYLM